LTDVKQFLQSLGKTTKTSDLNYLYVCVVELLVRSKGLTECKHSAIQGEQNYT